MSELYSPEYHYESAALRRLEIRRGIPCAARIARNLPAATPVLLVHCAERVVCVSFMSRNGRFLARVEGSPLEMFSGGAVNTIPVHVRCRGCPRCVR